MGHKILSIFMTLSILISSTLTPLVVSKSYASDPTDQSILKQAENDQIDDPSPEDDEVVETINDQNLNQDIQTEIEKEDLAEATEEVDQISSSDESLEDEEETRIIEKTVNVSLYEDRAYKKLSDKNVEIKIKGLMPEEGSIKSYEIPSPMENLDTENILSFAFELFDEDGNIYPKDQNSEYQIEVKSEDIKDAKNIFLYQKQSQEANFKEISDFEKLSDSLKFYSIAEAFSIEKEIKKVDKNEESEKGYKYSKENRTSLEDANLDTKVSIKKKNNQEDTKSISKTEDILDNFIKIVKEESLESRDLFKGKEDQISPSLLDLRKYLVNPNNEEVSESLKIQPNNIKISKGSLTDEELEDDDQVDCDTEKNLNYQQILADICTDSSYTNKAVDNTSIKLSGYLPEFTEVRAYPVEVNIKNQEVLAAYDITIFDENKKEYKISEKNDINVQITNQKIKDAKKIEVYHKENKLAPEEKVDVKNKDIDTVTFKAESFSIYAVTDPKAQAIRTYKFYVRNADGSLKLINTQTIRSGEMLQKPPVPILEDRGRYAGWFPIGESKQEHGDNEVHFFTPITFDTKTPVTIKAEPLFLDNAYIDFKERVYITEQNKKDFPIPSGYTLSDDGYYRNNQGEKLYRDEVYKTRVQDFDKAIGEAHIPVIKDEALANPDQASPVLSYWSIDPEGGEIFDFSETITRDLIRRQEQISGENQLVRLDLFAIYEDGYTVSFDSQGGSHVTRQIVKKGESLNTDKIIDPIKPGYVFRGWSLTPDGEIIDLENRIITQSKTLYAIYDKLPGTYTVSHYTENINDTGFTFYNSETKVEQVGNYTKDGEYFRNPANSEIAKDLVGKGYTVPISVTPSDKPALVKADGSTNIKVYYRRPRYNLTVYSTGLFQGVPTRQFIVQYKEGEDTKDSWDRMGQILGRYVVREGSLDGPIMKVPPKMPAHDLSLYFLPTRGNEEWYTNYIEVDENDVPIRDENGNLKVIRKTTHNAIFAGLENYVGGDTVEGFEYRYVTQRGQHEDSPKVYTRGQPKEVRTFYKRLSYKLVFKTNNVNYDDKIKTVPYETKIAPLVPTDIKIGDTDKNGATFKGWYDNPQLTGLPIEFTNLTMPAKDTTYFGKWEQQKHNIRIYREMTTPGQVSSPDKIINFQVNRGSMLKRDDAAWNPIKPAKLKDDPNAKLTWYRFSGTEFEEYKFDEPMTEDLFLYPVWSYFDPVTQSYRPLEDIHTITYTDGTNSFTDKNLYLNNAAAILQAPYVLGSVDKLEDPENLNKTYFGNLKVPEGKHFQGWLLNNDPSRIYRPGEVINVTSDMTFYAKWGEYGKTQIDLYEQKPGTDKSKFSTEKMRENGTIKLPTPSASNYIFQGWSKSPTGSVDFKAGKEVMVTNENLPNRLYGIWKANSNININEKQPSGSVKTYTLSADANNKIKLTKPATINGYKFLGWSTEEGAKVAEYKPDAEITISETSPAPTNLYGVWQVQRLTFKSNYPAGSFNSYGQPLTNKSISFTSDADLNKMFHNYSKTSDTNNIYLQTNNHIPAPLGYKLLYFQSDNNPNYKLVGEELGTTLLNNGSVYTAMWSKPSTVNLTIVNPENLDISEFTDINLYFNATSGNITTEGLNAGIKKINGNTFEWKIPTFSNVTSVDLMDKNSNESFINIGYTVEKEGYTLRLEQISKTNSNEFEPNDGYTENLRLVVSKIYPVPTGVIDNIAPMALILALATMAFAYRFYKKDKIAGGIDE